MLLSLAQLSLAIASRPRQIRAYEPLAEPRDKIYHTPIYMIDANDCSASLALILRHARARARARLSLTFTIIARRKPSRCLRVDESNGL